MRAGRGKEGRRGKRRARSRGEGIGRGGGRVGPQAKACPQNYFSGAGAVLLELKGVQEKKWSKR